jgi:hypothetical protein
MINFIFKLSELLNKFAFYYLTKTNKIGKYILSYEVFFMLISQFKLLRESKIYNILKLMFKLIIYFNLFMLSTDFILKYEADEIYNIFINIFNNLKNISYTNIKDILNYFKEKFYMIDKLYDLIKDNSIENNSNKSIDNNNSNNISSSNNYTFYVICGIVSSIVLYIYYINDDNNMNDLFKDLSHLKHINNINDNDSLIDMNLDESGYFSNPIPTDDFLNPVKRTSSLD